MTTDREGLENLPALLDLAAFEKTPSGLFRPLGALPGWLKLDDPAQEIDLADRYPLLELFFSECAEVFETGNPPRWIRMSGKKGRARAPQFICKLPP
jgi:hypothetical protein